MHSIVAHLPVIIVQLLRMTSCINTKTRKKLRCSTQTTVLILLPVIKTNILVFVSLVLLFSDKFGLKTSLKNPEKYHENIMQQQAKLSHNDQNIFSWSNQFIRVNLLITICIIWGFSFHFRIRTKKISQSSECIGGWFWVVLFQFFILKHFLCTSQHP